MAVQLATTRNVFGPSEIAKLSTAYEAAISAVTEENDTWAEMTAREIRHQLASVIIAEAKQGQLDPERLKEAALQSLATPFPDPDSINYRSRDRNYTRRQRATDPAIVQVVS